MSVPVWLGVPLEEYALTAAEEVDPFLSKIGGFPVWLRPKDGQMECPKCKSSTSLRLLCQINAPLKVYDRILYVFTCEACGDENSSTVFAMRSSVYNPQYDQPASAAGKQVEGRDEPAGALFKVDDDWGDDDAGEAPAVQPSTAPPVQVTPEERPAEAASTKVAFTLAPSGKNVGRLPAAPYLTIALDTIPEPAKEKVDYGSLEDQLKAVEETHGPGTGVIDMTSVEEDDDETDDERLLRKFVKRISRCPAQCLRWSPEGPPLLCRSERSQKIPDCPCGSPRRFEFQLVPPAIYFLTRAQGEKNNKLHFGNVLVYTCSSECYREDVPYSPEYVVVQPEI